MKSIILGFLFIFHAQAQDQSARGQSCMLALESFAKSRLIDVGGYKDNRSNAPLTSFSLILRNMSVDNDLVPLAMDEFADNVQLKLGRAGQVTNLTEALSYMDVPSFKQINLSLIKLISQDVAILCDSEGKILDESSLETKIIEYIRKHAKEIDQSIISDNSAIIKSRQLIEKRYDVSNGSSSIK